MLKLRIIRFSGSFWVIGFIAECPGSSRPHSIIHSIPFHGIHPHSIPSLPAITSTVTDQSVSGSATSMSAYPGWHIHPGLSRFRQDPPRHSIPVHRLLALFQNKITLWQGLTRIYWTAGHMGFFFFFTCLASQVCPNFFSSGSFYWRSITFTFGTSTAVYVCIQVPLYLPHSFQWEVLLN